MRPDRQLNAGSYVAHLVVRALVVQALRYNASRTLYRNLRFGFGSQAEQGGLWRELLLLLVLAVLLIPTLGGLWPYLAWRWRRLSLGKRECRGGGFPARRSGTL